MNQELIACYFADIGDQDFIKQDEEILIFNKVDEHRYKIQENIDYIFRGQLSIPMGLLWFERARSMKNYLYGIHLDYNRSILDILDKASDSLIRETNIRSAREYVITRNLKLVVQHAKKYEKVAGFMELSDLIQEGNLGLLQGFERFKITLGFRFSTYAVWWIRHAISKSLADTDSLIRVPAHIHQLINKLNVFERDFIREQNRKPNYHEIVDHFGKDFGDKGIVQLRDALKGILPFDGKSSSDEIKKTVEETTGVVEDHDKNLEQLDISEYIENRLEDIVGCLTDIERQVFYMRYNIVDRERYYSTEDVANILNIPVPRVVHIEALSILKIRHDYQPLMIPKLFKKIREKHERRHKRAHGSK